jgi:hypothetical protein
VNRDIGQSSVPLREEAQIDGLTFTTDPWLRVNQDKFKDRVFFVLIIKDLAIKDFLTNHNRMSPRLGRFARCEAEFAALVHNFIAGIDPIERRHCEYICRSWAGAWAQNMPGTILQAGEGLAQFQDEATRTYWRQQYYARRDRILTRKHERYLACKKARQQHEGGATRG